jgi:hypothetical protein
MKISRHDKRLLVEMEFLSLLLIIVLGIVFLSALGNWVFYLVALLIGFVLFFWMVYEEQIHKTGKKHVYFEHTSSYIMLGQTSLVLALLFIKLKADFLSVIFMVISVIMYSVSLSRILMYKAAFPR